MNKRWWILFSAFMVLWCAPAGAATINVTTPADEQNVNGRCSLREAMINANLDNQSGSTDCLPGNGADIIVFTEDLSGTITLGSPLPDINQNLTIKGRPDWTIEISGNYAVGIFEISQGGPTVNLQDLVIAKGSTPNGGGVRANSGVFLNIKHCRFTENFARYGTYGGGVLNYKGTVNIIDSEFSKNWADIGGAIDNDGTLIVKNCTFQGNEARVGSGISTRGTADIVDSRFESNIIQHSGGGISNSGELTLRNSTIAYHETATGQGAGISNVAIAELDGVTITKNRAGLGGGIFNSGTMKLLATTVEDNRAECSGGGIFNSETGRLDLNGEKGACKISRNEATNEGGGIYSDRGAVMIGNSEIFGNHSQGSSGGGIFNYEGTLEIRETTISSNSAEKGGGLYSTDGATLYGVFFSNNRAYGSGAGAFLCGGRNYMQDVTFDKNEAEKDGAGIFNAGTLILTKGTFTKNTNTAGTGGGIYNDGIAESSLSTFAENLSIKGGGGIYNNGPLKVAGCTFQRNGAGGNGGAIYNKYIRDGANEFRIVNSTLSGNMTDSKGGGIYNEGSEMIVANTTLAGNTALGQRGNLFNQSGVVKLQNTLITGDQPGSNCAGTYTSLGYNLASDGSCGLTQATDLSNTAPLIGALADNGGFTWTHALLVGSPAIDKVPKNVNDCGGSINTDQRGITRPQPSAGNCDIGAYEKRKFSWTWPWWEKWPVHR